MRYGIAALIVAVACAAPAAAQTPTPTPAAQTPTVHTPQHAAPTFNNHLVANALLGPSFVGQDATFNSRIALGYRANDWLSVVGEWGEMPKATAETSRLAGQHFNGNVVLTAPNVLWNYLRPYGTFGVGEFRNSNSNIGVTDVNTFAVNYGAGIGYDFSKWASFGLDYRRFEVNMDPHKGDNRFTAGFTLGLR